jgi:hypothetical protein
MTSAASDLATIGSNVSAAHMVAAARTTAVIPAAADEVSASIAHLFSQHAASYQALAGRAAAFQEQFAQHLSAGAFSYTDVEAALAAFLQNSPLIHPHLGETGPIGHWFVTPITFFATPTSPGFTDMSGNPLPTIGYSLSPEQLLGLALIAPIYIPALLAAEAIILPIVFVGSLLTLPLAIGSGL